MKHKQLENLERQTLRLRMKHTELENDRQYISKLKNIEQIEAEKNNTIENDSKCV